MKLSRLLVSFALALGVATPVVVDATAQAAHAGPGICVPCLFAGGNVLSGNI